MSVIRTRGELAHRPAWTDVQAITTSFVGSSRVFAVANWLKSLAEVPPTEEMKNMPELMDIPLGGRGRVGQLEDELWATSHGAGDHVVHPVVAPARSAK